MVIKRKNNLRVDKFLKVSRLIKRRTTAKSAAENNRVLVNGKQVKPSFTLKVGDKLSVVFGTHQVDCTVKHLCEKQAKNANEPMFSLDS